MIQTRTEVRCDGCGRTLLGDLGDHANREFTALATVRERGWRRQWVGKSLHDLCPRCHRRAARRVAGRPGPRGFRPWWPAFPRLRAGLWEGAGLDPAAQVRTRPAVALAALVAGVARRGWCRILAAVAGRVKPKQLTRNEPPAGLVLSGNQGWFTLTVAAWGQHPTIEVRGRRAADLMARPRSAYVHPGTARLDRGSVPFQGLHLSTDPRCHTTRLVEPPREEAAQGFQEAA